MFDHGDIPHVPLRRLIEDWIYPPGSDEAVRRGCLCPILDNGHGRGFMGIHGKWVRTLDCPLHGGKEEEKHETTNGR